MAPVHPHSINRPFALLLLLLLPLTACGRYNARTERQKIRYFAEILKREDGRAIGTDGFFRDNLLGNRDLEVRRWCALALGRIGDPQALPLLYGALHGGDAEVRAASAFAIGQIEDREAVDARCSAQDPRAVLELFRLLDDSSISVRTRAVEALGRIASRSTDAADVVRRLERFPDSNSAYEKAYLNAAITALARMGNPAAIPFLVRLADMRDPEIRSRALEARTRIQDGATDMQAGETRRMPDEGPVPPCGLKETNEPGPESGSITNASSIALAANRKNSTIAQIETTRGTIEIELFREQAPVTAEQFVAMAKRGVYNDTAFAVTAPHQIIEGGNPQEWPGLRRIIRREANMRPFERGRVGMAIAGRGSDAGRFFIALTPQPYLDGINTCFGHVISGMPIADTLTSGDRIRRITIREYVHFHDYQRY